MPAKRDALDFQPYIDTLADVISSPNTQTPLTIGVFGGWGSGKTTLMGLVEKGFPHGGLEFPRPIPQQRLGHPAPFLVAGMSDTKLIRSMYRPCQRMNRPHKRQTRMDL